MVVSTPKEQALLGFLGSLGLVVVSTPRLPNFLERDRLADWQPGAKRARQLEE
jgi:hypothetical protein